MDSNCKVYARQIPYEWQESPWDLWGAEQMITDKAAIYGDEQLQGYTFDEFDKVLTALDEMDLTDVGEITGIQLSRKCFWITCHQ